MTWRGTLLIVFCCYACARAAPRAEPPRTSERPLSECGSADPLGTIAELHTAVGASEGPWIDAPEVCNEHQGWDGGAYIRVRGRGTRRFVRSGGCTSAPQNPDACPAMDLDAFGTLIAQRVNALSSGAGGFGLGPCSDALFLDHSHWRGRVDFTTSVTRWQDADAAIRIVSELLDAWGVGDSYGVSVRGITCAVLL